jgi:hypothetical protein
MLKIKLATDPSAYSNTTYYDIDMVVEKDGEEYEIMGTLSVMQDDTMASTEMDFNLVDSPIDFSDEELDEISDFAQENYMK